MEGFSKYFSLLMCLLPLLAEAKLQWGDQGDGSFINPVLNADYSDPDVIRVGDKYYLTCSEFHFMGMPVLESDDLVNWRIIARVFDSLPGYDLVNKYAEGTWAPAIRYHDGLFYIYVCTPHEGLWVTTASDPAGPWSPMHLIHEADRWEDPCPFWDEQGNAYLGRSQWGAGPIYVHRMSADGMRLLDDGVIVYEGPVAEGTKFYAKDGYVYLSIPEGGVRGGWQTVLRARDIYGPYEGHRVLEQGSTAVNGPHQGALVDTPEGDWWFYHFQETPIIGRVMHLQPVVWVDGFPQIGTDYDGNGVGEPMHTVRYTDRSRTVLSLPDTDDDFSADSLSIIWQFNHNPVLDRYDLDTRKGWLTWTPMYADSLKYAKNTLTQKAMGYQGTVSVRLDCSHMAEGQRAGLISMGKYNHGAGVMVRDGVPMLYVESGGEIVDSHPLEADSRTVTLVYKYDNDANTHEFGWTAEDGQLTMLTPQPLKQRWGNWKGLRIGLYNYTMATEGLAHFDDFKVRLLR